MTGPLQDNNAFRFEYLSLKNNLQGIGIFQQLVGWIQEDNIKHKLFLAQVDNAAVVITLYDPVKIRWNTNFFNVVPEQLDGFFEAIDKNNVLGPSGKGFNSDITAAGKTIQEYLFPHLILEYIKK